MTQKSLIDELEARVVDKKLEPTNATLLKKTFGGQAAPGDSLQIDNTLNGDTTK